MMLKREYNTAGEVVAIKVLRAGPQQNFSVDFLERALAEGWATLSQGKLLLHTEPPLTYKILRGPGHYCCYCNERLVDAAVRLPDGLTVGQTHVAENHPQPDAKPGSRLTQLFGRRTAQTAVVGPIDPSNPSGYRRDNFYACVKEE